MQITSQSPPLWNHEFSSPPQLACFGMRCSAFPFQPLQLRTQVAGGFLFVMEIKCRTRFAKLCLLKVFSRE